MMRGGRRTEGGGGGRRRRMPSSPRASSTSSSPLSVSVLGNEEEEEEDEGEEVLSGRRDWRSISISNNSEDYNPRSFPYNVKQKCWDKADKIKGRDPDRWRRDPLGNIVFRKLVGCPGCLCHDYDHITPFSKGGKSTLENCQVLQATVNRSKGNRTEVSKADLIQKSAYCRVSGRDMDLLELSAYGNVHRGQDSGGCNIQ
ncbi:hypothetical protein AAC387_Pa11g2300 [Persea americana]|eukprot:TRINITY_DN336_c1_g1_i1.p1 TRINITY_DN336_c1_g1~~TRINITY_DN336_c1_g1_i1.p1  ORF type:complete len:200 (+),score=32.13 TRINITY_DN336_c1_g1_i1:113-712(+)